MLNAVDFPYFNKMRHLKFDINAIADVERELGIGISAILNSDRMGFDVLRVMLWAGLKHEDSTLSPKKIGDWIQKYMVDNKTNLVEALSEFQNSILEAFKESGLFGEIAEVEEDVEVKNVIAEIKE